MTRTILSVEDFGRQLIVTGDLDPVYIALRRVEWPEEQHKRWLVAYWLFYHPGFACWASEKEGDMFWAVLDVAARNEVVSPLGERWPRASERRHFRGEKAIKAIAELRRRFPLAGALVDFVDAAGPNYQMLFNRVCSLPQFGPWMAFKVADMLERCLDTPIDFDLGSVTMFDDPRKAALMVYKAKSGFDPTDDSVKLKNPDAVILTVVEHLIKEFQDLSAPPSDNRPIGFQEVETVLCKWKSHVNGHYPVGKDCHEIRAGLAAWGAVSEAAREFYHEMPDATAIEEPLPTPE
jgi:hypothetical protein